MSKPLSYESIMELLYRQPWWLDTVFVRLCWYLGELMTTGVNIGICKNPNAPAWATWTPFIPFPWHKFRTESHWLNFCLPTVFPARRVFWSNHFYVHFLCHLSFVLKIPVEFRLKSFGSETSFAVVAYPCHLFKDFSLTFSAVTVYWSCWTMLVPSVGRVQ